MLGKTSCAGPRSGLSLIELLMTATLLGIGLSAVSTMFIYGYRAQLNAHYTTAATDIARRHLEEMRAAGFNGIGEETFPPTFAVPELPRGVGTISYIPYPDDAVENQYLAQVAVSWESARSIRGHVALATVIVLQP